MGKNLIDLIYLCRYRSGTLPVISFYLNTKPPVNIATACHSLIAAKKKYLAKRDWPEATIKDLEGNLEKIDKYVNGLVSTDKMRSLAIFAGKNIWDVYRLPINLQSKCYIDPYPYIKDLSAALDQYKEYILLVLDRNNAKFFNFYLGELDEVLNFIHEDVPQQVKGTGHYQAGGGMLGISKGYRGDKVQRHINDHLRKFLDKARDQLSILLKSKKIDKWLIGGREDALTEFTKQLDQNLKKKLIGKFTINIKSGINDITKKSAQVIADYERDLEKELLDRLVNQSKPVGRGVLGQYNTFNSLMLGEIHQLFIKNDLKMKGYICFKDNLCQTNAGQCQICGDPLIKVADLTNEIIRIALNQKASVKHVFYPHEIFDKHQVGALRRFAV